MMLGTILLWHHRPRHRLVLKSEKVIEGRDLITLNLTVYVMRKRFKLNDTISSPFARGHRLPRADVALIHSALQRLRRRP
jgi:hypothetical protein